MSKVQISQELEIPKSQHLYSVNSLLFLLRQPTVSFISFVQKHKGPN